MEHLRLRSATAITLSLWLGVLACVLGCAKPMAAASERLSSGAQVNCPDRSDEAGDSCCRHGHEGSGKTDHHAKSCCPTETALTQKKSDAAAPMVFVHVNVLALPGAEAATFVFESARSNVPVVSQTGRDILRQVHVLRI